MPSFSKAPGVFLSMCKQAASSQPFQLRRAPAQDSCQLVRPFMRAGTYPARGYATLELSRLELSFTGACTRAFPSKLEGSTPALNLPALDRSQLLYIPYTGLQEPVFLINSRLANFRCAPPKRRGEHLGNLTLSFFAEFLEPASPECLGVLHQPTCVGLRYGLRKGSLINFSRRLIELHSPSLLKDCHHSSPFNTRSKDLLFRPRQRRGWSQQTSSLIK
jgi:hypothetical protein